MLLAGKSPWGAQRGICIDTWQIRHHGAALDVHRTPAGAAWSRLRAQENLLRACQSGLVVSVMSSDQCA